MEELKKYCSVCEEEKNIIKIETTQQKEVIKFSCGHAELGFELTRNTITVDRLQKKYRDVLSWLLDGYPAIIDSIIRGERERPTKSIVVIDWERQMVFFKVLEQNQKGEWELEYEEEKPLKG